MFVISSEIEREQLTWGSSGVISGPLQNGAKQIVTLNVGLKPGLGHDFHRHPTQEEVIYVLEGQIEQWVGEEKRMLNPGDAAFIPAGVVHASFNSGSGEARVLAILGPAVGADGYEVEEVADQAPWKSLRS